VVEVFVDGLDLGEVGFVGVDPAATGRPAYHPAVLLKLYIYGYLNRIQSSRRLEREAQRNVELMWLLNRLAPDHKTIAEFRRREGAALRAVAAAFVRFCRGQGLIGGEWLAIDGSKFEALEAQGIVAHIPANRAVNNQGEGTFFDRTSFAYDAASDTLRCPAGQTLQRKQLQRGKHRVLYAAEIGDCGSCVLKARCTASPRRFVARNLHEAALHECTRARRLS